MSTLYFVSETREGEGGSYTLALIDQRFRAWIELNELELLYTYTKRDIYIQAVLTLTLTFDNPLSLPRLEYLDSLQTGRNKIRKSLAFFPAFSTP